MARRKQEIRDDGTIVEDIMADAPYEVQRTTPNGVRHAGFRPIKQIIDEFYTLLISHPDCKVVEHAISRVPRAAAIEGISPLNQKLLELKFVFKSVETESPKQEGPRVDPYGPGGKYYHLIPQRTATEKSIVTETIPPRASEEERVSAMVT